MHWIFKRLSYMLKPRMLEGFVVWQISTIEPDYDNLTMSHIDFAWPHQSEQKVIDRFKRNSGYKANTIITAVRQKPSWRMFLYQLPFMATGLFYYWSMTQDGKRGSVLKGWNRRHALFMDNVAYELSTLCTHWTTNQAHDTKLMGFKDHISWHLTNLFSHIEPPQVEWSENPFAWPHACDQAGCGMHKKDPYCSYQSKWCKLAQKIRPDVERKLAKRKATPS